MEVIISALALLISVLMGIPTRAKDATDAKKARLGKKLTEITLKLDSILRRAHVIIDLIDQLPTASDQAMKRAILNRLLATIDEQIEDLSNIGKEIQSEFLWGFQYQEIPELDSFKILHSSTDVYKILSIYQPDLGDRLEYILEYKTNLLVGLSYVLKDEIIKIVQQSATIREIRKIDLGLISSQLGKYRFQEQLQEAEDRGLIEFEEINILDQESVSQYLSRARQRLSEIQVARKNLNDFIREQFSPHELI